MGSLFITMLTFAYASLGFVSLAAYWPTIKDLLQKRPSANTTSYQIWAFTTAVAFLYSLFVLKDFWFRVISGINFMVVTLIAILSFRFKKG